MKIRQKFYHLELKKIRLIAKTLSIVQVKMLQNENKKNKMKDSADLQKFCLYYPYDI